jgi:ABC-type Fe3+ transport system substrate-binding protein
VLASAAHPAAGAEFVAYLLSSDVRAERLRAGFELTPAEVHGQAAAAPARLRAALASG